MKQSISIIDDSPSTLATFNLNGDTQPRRLREFTYVVDSEWVGKLSNSIDTSLLEFGKAPAAILVDVAIYLAALAFVQYKNERTLCVRATGHGTGIDFRGTQIFPAVFSHGIAVSIDVLPFPSEL